MRIKSSRLKNGIILDTVSSDGVASLTILIMVRTGSRNEGKAEAGLSHFLEHMFFKGTKNRPTTLMIAKELDSLGASYNAFTGKEYTGYWVKVSTEHYERSLDILSDMLLNPLFEEEEMVKEKGAVIQEINMYEDSPRDYVGVLFEEDYLGKNTLGRSIAGSRESVAAISHDQLTSYAKRFYQPKNISIVVAGALPKTHAGIASDMEQNFGKLSSVSKKSGVVYTNKLPKKSVAAVHFKKTEQTNLVFGIPAYSYKKRRAELNIISTMLGGNMSSRLFIEVRERRGLAYYIYSWVENFHETGYLGIHTGIDNKRVEEAAEVVRDETRKLSRMITLKDIGAAKDYLVGSMILKAENSYTVAYQTARDRVYGVEPLSLEQRIREIKRVKPAEVKSIANEILSRPISISMIGPMKDKAPFVKLLGG